MNLKNYTSSVPVETTVSRIEQNLIATELEAAQKDIKRVNNFREAVALKNRNLENSLAIAEQQLADKTRECGDIHAELIQAKETFVNAFPKLLKQDVEIRQLRAENAELLKTQAIPFHTCAGDACTNETCKLVRELKKDKDGCISFLQSLYESCHNPEHERQIKSFLETLR